MASLRKRYQTQLASSDKDDGPPVLSPPSAGAKLPEPVETKPIEPVVESNPAEAAASSAIKQRLAEMERAEALQQQPPPQHIAEPPQEPQDPLAHLPPRVQRWYREHPELATDPERAAQVQYCHHVARREVGQEFTDPYFDRMEAMLFGRATNGHDRPTPRPANVAPAQRVSEPPRQPARMSAPVSAPPTREAPSYSTGRPLTRRAPLTPAQREAAQFSGVSEDEYARQLEKQNRLKAAGELQ